MTWKKQMGQIAHKVESGYSPSKSSGSRGALREKLASKVEEAGYDDEGGMGKYVREAASHKDLAAIKRNDVESRKAYGSGHDMAKLGEGKSYGK